MKKLGSLNGRNVYEIYEQDGTRGKVEGSSIQEESERGSTEDNEGREWEGQKGGHRKGIRKVPGSRQR